MAALDCLFTAHNWEIELSWRIVGISDRCPNEGLRILRRTSSNACPFLAVTALGTRDRFWSWCIRYPPEPGRCPRSSAVEQGISQQL